jgi:hypothetical protein
MIMVKSKKISELTLLENNPRQISKENFYRLKKSLQRDPGFLKMRPVLAYPQDDQLIVYAGNQRVRAAKELGWDEIPVIIDEQANLEQIRQRILLDNVEFGEFDKDILANNWGIEELQELDLPEIVGIIEPVINPDSFETDFTLPDGDRAPFQQMTFTFASPQAEFVKDMIEKIKGSKEYAELETYGNENSNGNALFCLIQKAYG